MTLRALAARAGMDAPPEGHAVTREVSLAFAVDTNYLEMLRVCLASLLHSGSFLDSPIVIYSDEPEVFECPAVRAAVDRPVLIDGARRDLLHDLARTAVRDRGRAAWNKGTFLKWAVLEAQPTPHVLFLDVDMIFPRTFDVPLLEAAGDASFAYVPQFRQWMLFDRITREQPDPSDRLRYFDDAFAGEFTDDMRPRVNSGLRLIGPDLLDGGFFEALVARARKKKWINEQSHFTAYFEEHPGIARAISARFNYQEHYGRDMSWPHWRKVLRKVSILHYTGQDKPWNKMPRAQDWRPSTALWHWHRSAAEPILRLGREGAR